MHPRADDIVEAARSYVGMRWRHQGRVAAGGIDCIGLIVLVGRDMGLWPLDFDPVEGYNRQPDGRALKAGLCRYLTIIPAAEMSPGDVLLFSALGRFPFHVGVLATGPLPKRDNIIHANVAARKVVETQLHESFWKVYCASFRYPEEAVVQ